VTGDSTIDRFSRRVRLAVGQRLLLGLAPALLAVVVVLALAYYGELGRQAPEYVVAGAAVLALTSLVLTWRNTRYVVGRLRRLGRLDEDALADDVSTPLDDLDRIEHEVVRLNDALQQATAQAEHERKQAAARGVEQATLLAATLRGVTVQLQEIRLPLHILLDARFGVLNENQEELLVAARAGADAIDAAIRRLEIVADADRGALAARLEPVSLNDVVRAVLPMVRASADRRGARVEPELEPALPRAWADRAALAEAVALLATLAAEALGSDESLHLTTSHSASHCTLRMNPFPPDASAATLGVVAQRMLQAQGVALSVSAHAATIEIPRAAT